MRIGLDWPAQLSLSLTGLRVLDCHARYAKICDVDGGRKIRYYFPVAPERWALCIAPAILGYEFTKIPSARVISRWVCWLARSHGKEGKLLVSAKTLSCCSPGSVTDRVATPQKGAKKTVRVRVHGLKTDKQRDT